MANSGLEMLKKMHGDSTGGSKKMKAMAMMKARMKGRKKKGAKKSKYAEALSA